MIAVDGTVALEVDGAPIALVAKGDRVRVHAERPSALLQSGSPGALRSLSDVADRLGLTVEVTSGERTLLVAGRGAGGGVGSRLLRFEHVSVPLRSVPTLIRARYGRRRS